MNVDVYWVFVCGYSASYTQLSYTLMDQCAIF